MTIEKRVEEGNLKFPKEVSIERFPKLGGKPISETSLFGFVDGFKQGIYELGKGEDGEPAYLFKQSINYDPENI